MNFNMFHFNSKTFLLGSLMTITGVAEAAGIPGVGTALRTIFGYGSMGAGELITGGLGFIFLRDAIHKMR